MVSQWNEQGLVTVISGDRFIVLDKTKSEATAILKARGLNDRLIEITLRNSCPAAEWRHSFLAAAAAAREATTCAK